MAFDPNKITLFAKTDARGKHVTFGIKAKDRQRHVYVIGKTGMGKSTLLENMAVQDIQSGEGMAFIDPHGSAAETLLNYIPEHRIKDVLYFAPFDTDNPVSFNIMEDVGPDKRHLVVSGLMSVFKKIWVDAWSARMEYILSNTILALLEYPDSTLLGVNRMLSDKEYRNKVVENVKDPGVKSFWIDEFAKYNERYMQEAGDAIKNKIGQFTSNPVIRNIVGQPKSSFDIRKMMDEKKILIINLSKGLIGESNANLLGSMLTTRIYLAAMSRADLPPEKMKEMPNFYFYVDEFQSFANATFANILSEARKYHLNLTIAHQYIEQMEEEVRNAVFGNVGTVIAFRVGPFDAEVLETIFTPQFTATDIVNLSFAQIYLTLMIDGIGSQPFSATTLPPIAPPAVSFKEMAIAESRARFTVPRATAEEMIHKFHEPVKKTPKPSDAVVPNNTNHRSEERRKVERVDVPQVNGRDHMPPKTEQFAERRKQSVAVPPDHERRSLPRRNGNGSSGEHRPHPPKIEKPAPLPVAPEKHKPSTEDLKAVLRSLVQTPPVEKKQEPEKKRDPEGLKAVLQAALSAEKHVPSVPPPPPVIPTPPTPPTPQVVAPMPPKVDPTPTLSPQPETPKPVSNPVHEGKISPRELERMMRITTSDKPPV